jgi:hypothetical protein
VPRHRRPRPLPRSRAGSSPAGASLASVALPCRRRQPVVTGGAVWHRSGRLEIDELQHRTRSSAGRSLTGTPLPALARIRASRRVPRLLSERTSLRILGAFSARFRNRVTRAVPVARPFGSSLSSKPEVASDARPSPNAVASPTDNGSITNAPARTRRGQQHAERPRGDRAALPRLDNALPVS